VNACNRVLTIFWFSLFLSFVFLEQLNSPFHYCVFVCILPEKAIPEMTCTVSGGMLNPTHSLILDWLEWVRYFTLLYLQGGQVRSYQFTPVCILDCN